MLNFIKLTWYITILYNSSQNTIRYQQRSRTQSSAQTEKNFLTYTFLWIKTRVYMHTYTHIHMCVRVCEGPFWETVEAKSRRAMEEEDLETLNCLLESKNRGILRVGIWILGGMLWSGRGTNCRDGSSGEPAAEGGAEVAAESEAATVAEGKMRGLRSQNRYD